MEETLQRLTGTEDSDDKWQETIRRFKIFGITFEWEKIKYIETFSEILLSVIVFGKRASVYAERDTGVFDRWLSFGMEFDIGGYDSILSASLTLGKIRFGCNINSMSFGE